MSKAAGAMKTRRRSSTTWHEANTMRLSLQEKSNPSTPTSPTTPSSRASVGSFSSPVETIGVSRPSHMDITRGVYAGKVLAVFTSGGDSQGMNAAVRAVVRMGLFVGARVFLIREGYQGMVDGGDHIIEAHWPDVTNIIQKGGTVIGSARCQEMRTRSGVLKAAKNLVLRGITNIVCIGGDGSLTGASRLKEQWPDLLEELVAGGEVSAEQAASASHLNIVGMVGSIDNDFCGTDMTIGADSALHRIVEAVDAILTTADSHRRSFVLEVMGRHCGYLALVAGIACEADYIFIPEDPPKSDWESSFCDHLRKCREIGQRLNIILVAEGAQDEDGKPISANYVKDICSNKLGLDTRVTVLGHVQRGGAPSAFDRTLATRLGAEAVIALMEATPMTEPCVISLSGNQAIRVPLMQCVKLTKSVQEAMDAKNFVEAATLRGRSFLNNLLTYKKLACASGGAASETDRPRNLAVVHIGAPAGGMNAATRAFAKMAFCRGFGVKAVHDGIQGFINDNIVNLDSKKIIQWNSVGGSVLGCQRNLPTDDHVKELIAQRLEEHKICGLFVVGGFEGFRAISILQESRDKFPGLRIPICMLPATISNNVPGTDFSVGADTALNEITNCVDKLKQSATGSKRRVFVVETQGAYCGYLATMAGIAGGADQAYIFEEPFTLKHLQNDVDHVKSKIKDGVQRSLVLRAEQANKNYTTDFITRLYNEDGKGNFTAKTCVLGHIQQGGNPSPFDRNMATKLAAAAVEWILEMLEEDEDARSSPESCVVIGIVARHKTFTPSSQLELVTDFEHRIPKEQWWLRLRPLMRILAKHLDTYMIEGTLGSVGEED